MNNHIPKVKAILLLLLLSLAFTLCRGQKYEVRIDTAGVYYRYKSNLKYFNDSIITVTQKPSIINLFNPEDFNYEWETVTGLKIRNQTRHNTGLIIGTGVGLIAGWFIGNSILEKIRIILLLV